MAALLEDILPQVAPALIGKMHGRDAASTIVRVGRFVYGASLFTTAAFWYWGWRNERVAPGSNSFPIPLLYKGTKQYSGAADADAPGDVSLTDPTVSPSPSAGNGPLTKPPGTDSLGPIFPGGSPSGNHRLLMYLGHVAQSSAFKLTVSENPDFGGVTPGVHVQGSYHYIGRAFDASKRGDSTMMAAYANWVADNYGPQITELFWRGPQWVIIKNGVRQLNFNFVTGHQDHVHVAV